MMAHVFSPTFTSIKASINDSYVQVTYTVGRDPQYMKNIVSDTSPLFTAPVIVRTIFFSINENVLEHLLYFYIGCPF